jgi:D-alanyl-D-alanine carboxypeptidase/D-alanyl-D-alanine-endopeptidase (penicillin-binding protein 4)
MTGLKRYAVYLVLLASYLFASCGVHQQLSRSAKETVLQQPAFKAAHTGISIYEPATGKYWFNYQGDKYFVPASNTKIPTCYAAMKYLGDSLVGLKYSIPKEKGYSDDVILIRPAGDPTFLHEDFIEQPTFDFLKTTISHKKKILLYYNDQEVEKWGAGWSWNDYEAAYMAERNTFPVLGNVITIRLENNPRNILLPRRFKTGSHYFDSLVNTEFTSLLIGVNPEFIIGRRMEENSFVLKPSTLRFSKQTIPFITGERFDPTVRYILEDTLKVKLNFFYKGYNNNFLWGDRAPGSIIWDSTTINTWFNVYSQPTDSLLKPMMHRSDNFFAEQSLLMVSNELLGVMNDEKIIDTLLKTDFKDLPQKPRWADGSGLSRYNLFTPQDMVAILNKMKNEFGMERIKEIFPTGGEGTISSYYKNEAGFIYGKTGTLSGVVAFSGFLYTKKGKLLIFSTLVNNHNDSATDVRRAIENFLQGIRSNY